MSIKPTKVTKDDIELAEELNRITMIKGLLDDFSAQLTQHFAELSETSFQGNAVATHLTIQDKWDTLENATQILQVQLLRELGQVDEEDAHVLADPQVEAVPVVEAVEIDDALLGDQE